MFKQTPTIRMLLHVANLMVIVFILLPLVAVFIGSVQSEKALQADTRRLLPLEYTLDNFTVILSKGEQKGRIFEQVTYLPDNIKSFYTAFLNSAIVAISVTFLTLLFGSLSAYTIARRFASLDHISNGRFELGLGAGLADGIRCDVDGNVWAGAGWVGDGYDGVHVIAPDGTRIGLIRLPEICANLCFGGPDGRTVYVTEAEVKRVVQFRVDRPGLEWERNRTQRPR